MSRERKTPPFEALNNNGWIQKSRIIDKGHGGLEICLLNGKRVELRRNTAPCHLTIEPRDIRVTVLESGNIPKDVLEDVVRFVARGEMGSFIPGRNPIVEPVGVSRGMAFTHPLLPGKIIHASGVGIFSPDPHDPKGSVILSPPNPKMTIRQHVLNKGEETSMSTAIPQSDGSITSNDSSAIMGAYVLGTPSELRFPARGKETLHRKIAQTHEIGKKLQGKIQAPVPIVFGQYDDIPNAGWLFYTEEPNIEPLSVYKLGKQLDRTSQEKQYLYELFIYDFMYRVGLLHRNAKMYHGQMHMGNWKIVTGQNNNPPIAISDWGTSVDISQFSLQRANPTSLSPFEQAALLDVVNAGEAIVSAMYTDTENFDERAMTKISLIVSLALAGYFQPLDTLGYMNSTQFELAEYSKWQVEHGFIKPGPATKLIPQLIGDFMKIQFIKTPQRSYQGIFLSYPNLFH